MSKRKSIINFLVSIITQVVLMVLGFVVPRIILTSYGSDSNGVLNTIGQVFSYLALLEAGIGKSTRNALYEPLKNRKNQNASAILSEAKRYYTRTSLIYLVAILIMTFVLPLIMKSDLEYQTIALLILFEGLTNVVIFYFLRCKESLLIVDGKSYITSLTAFLGKVLKYGIKIILAICGVNIVLIQIGYFVVSLIEVLIFELYVRKKYSWINWNLPKGSYIFEDNKAYLVAEVSWTVFNSTDMIVLSIFVSTSIASVYSVYNLVFISFNVILSAAYNSILFNLGNAYVDGKDRFSKMYDFFNSFFYGTVTILMCVTYWLIIPFVRLYTSGVEDINYVYKNLHLLFCLVHLLSWAKTSSGTAIGVAGKIKKIAPVSIVETLLNIVFSIILVQFFDITGVLLATVLALPLEVLFDNIYFDKVILNRRPLESFKIIAPNMLVFVITVVFSQFILFKIDTIWSFIIYGFIFTFVYLTVCVSINIAFNKDILRIAKRIFKRNKTGDAV